MSDAFFREAAKSIKRDMDELQRLRQQFKDPALQYALAILDIIASSLARGVKHYDASGVLLLTPRQILEAIVNGEPVVMYRPQQDEPITVVWRPATVATEGEH